MKTKSFPLNLALVFLLALATADRRAVASDPIAATKSYAETDDNLELTVEVPSEPSTLTNCNLFIKLTNRGSAPYVVTVFGSVPWCIISAFSKDGSEYKRKSHLAEALYGPNSEPQYSVGRIFIPVGESHAWKLPLREVFDFEPGEIKLTVKLRSHKGTVGGIPVTIQ